MTKNFMYNPNDVTQNSVDYYQWFIRLDTQLDEPTKFLSQGIRKRYYKTLGTSVIKSPISPPSLSNYTMDYVCVCVCVLYYNSCFEGMTMNDVKRAVASTIYLSICVQRLAIYLSMLGATADVLGAGYWKRIKGRDHTRVSISLIEHTKNEGTKNTFVQLFNKKRNLFKYLKSQVQLFIIGLCM